MRNVARLPSHPPPRFICLVATLVSSEEFIHSSAGLRIETHARLTIFRIKEWDAGIYFGVGLAGPDSSHTQLHRFCCWKGQNNGVHIDICAADLLLNMRDMSWCSVQMFPMIQTAWYFLQYISLSYLILAGGLSIYTIKSFYDDVVFFFNCVTPINPSLSENSWHAFPASIWFSNQLYFCFCAFVCAVLLV